MKPRVGVYLSEGMAARLAEAAKRPGATKSALVEAALDRFLGSDDDIGDTGSVGRHLAGLSRQIEQLDRNLRIANETVALHARFHLAVTPLLPAAAQGAACALGAQRFEEFAAQVGRRVDQRISLIKETIDRATAGRLDAPGPDPTDGDPIGAGYAEEDVRASAAADEAFEQIAAVREDGSNGGFPGRTGGAFH
jgi:Ribbon-helix-helix protein, copG family